MAFVEVSEETIQKLVNEKDSNSTKRTVKRAVSLFRSFLSQRSLNPEFEAMNKTDLDSQLRLFYASLRKKGGDHMKKNTIDSVKYGLSKYLKQSMKIDIKRDEGFSSSNETYSAVVVDLRKKGYANVEHKPPISREDLEKLYQPNGLAPNVNTPVGLQNKVWFDIMCYLCRRGRENLREMSRETFASATDGMGRRYVYQVRDEFDKNHGCNDNPNDTIGEGRICERVGDPACPVASVLKYTSKLHPDNKAFWQNPVDSFTEDDLVWYTLSPHGKNTLSEMMSRISKLAKLSMVYTNHSIRATSLTELDEAGMEARHIMRISGHKSEASIRSYANRLSESKQREMSDCLSNTLSGHTTHNTSKPDPAAATASSVSQLPNILTTSSSMVPSTGAVCNATGPKPSTAAVSSMTQLEIVPNSNIVPSSAASNYTIPRQATAAVSSVTQLPVIPTVNDFAGFDFNTLFSEDFEPQENVPPTSQLLNSPF